MSIDCPFKDVREKFKLFLSELKNMGIKVPIAIHQSPSFFLHNSKIIQFENASQEASTTMISCFLSSGSN